MSEIEKTTDGDVRMGPASLYTTLKKLTEAGFIELMSEHETKKVYFITDVGLEALHTEIDKRSRYAAYGRQALEMYQEGHHE
jgi:DNA-binding PadR family transcriptional regulator